MKIILMARKWAYAIEFRLPVTVSRVEVHSSEDLEDETVETPEEETLKYDPRSTTSSHLERRTDMEDAYGRLTERPVFGFSKPPASCPPLTRMPPAAKESQSW